MTGPKDARFEIRLPEGLLAELEKAALDLRTSRSHIARLAIEHWLKTQKGLALAALAEEKGDASDGE